MFSKLTTGEKIFMTADYLFLLILMAVTLYPFLYILSASISIPEAVVRGEVWLFPKGFSLEAYKVVLKDKEIWHSYMNTIWYVVVGTSVSLFLTIITAYPLARRKFAGRRFIMLALAFTMFFSGGLVPSYLIVRNLNLIDSMWALVIPGAISTWYVIIMRTFFESIPESLFEAATIDGCNDIGILFRIVIFLSGPVIAVMILFFAVGQWNSYFAALIYLNDANKYPLQMILRKILIQFDTNAMLKDGFEHRDIVSQSVRYATIIVSTLPILCVYPFLQKHFVKGVMIGAIKG